MAQCARPVGMGRKQGQSVSRCRWCAATATFFAYSAGASLICYPNAGSHRGPGTIKPGSNGLSQI